MAFRLAEGMAQEPDTHLAVAPVLGRNDAFAQALQTRLAAANVDYLPAPDWPDGLAKLAGWISLAARIRRWQPDILHVHTDIPDFQASWLYRLGLSQGARLVRTIHNESLWQTRPIAGWLCESGLTDAAIAYISPATQQAYQALRARFGKPEAPIQVFIPNPVEDWEKIDTQEPAWQPPRPGEPLRLLFAGRFTAQKGCDLLAEALGQLPRNLWPQLQLDCLGQGDMQSAWQKLADMGFPIRLLGSQPEARRLFSSYHLMLMPSRWEGVPLTAIEAGGRGLPLLASSIPGLQSALPTDWPLWVTSPTAQAWAEALVQLVQNPPDWSLLSRQIRQHTRSAFSRTRTLQLYRDLYQQARG